jgi:hypothetical protein
MEKMIELASRELRHIAKLHGGEGFSSLQLVQWVKRHPTSALYECFDWSKSATDKQRASWFDAQWLDLPLERAAEALYDIFKQKIDTIRTALSFHDLPGAEKQQWLRAAHVLTAGATGKDT